MYYIYGMDHLGRVDQCDCAVAELRHHHVADARVRQNVYVYIYCMFGVHPRCIIFTVCNTLAVSTSATVPSLSCATITSRTRGCGRSESTPASISGVPAVSDEAGARKMRSRMATVVAINAVGYSRLMSDDAGATVTDLEAARAIATAHAEAHGARIADFAGDAVIAVFDTSLGAVFAAVAIDAGTDAGGLSEVDAICADVERISDCTGDPFDLRACRAQVECLWTAIRRDSH